MIDESCELYALIIESCKDLNRKKEVYNEYAAYLVKWGFIEQAREILTKKLRFTEMNLVEQK